MTFRNLVWSSVAALALPLCCAACHDDKSQQPVSPIRVLTTSPSLARLTVEIGGDLVQVRSLNKPGDDPFRTQIDKYSVGALASSEIFLQSGLNFTGDSDNINAFTEMLRRWDNKHNNIRVFKPTAASEVQDLPWLDPVELDLAARQITSALARARNSQLDVFEAGLTHLRTSLVGAVEKVPATLRAKTRVCLVTDTAWKGLLYAMSFPVKKVRFMPHDLFQFSTPIDWTNECVAVGAIAPGWSHSIQLWQKIPQLSACWEVGERPECNSVEELLAVNSHNIIMALYWDVAGDKR